MEEISTGGQARMLDFASWRVGNWLLTPWLTLALASAPLSLLAEDVEVSDLRVARARQNCADCYELPPCDTPLPPACEPCPQPLSPAEPMPDETGAPTAEAQPAEPSPADQGVEDMFDTQRPPRSSALPSGLGAVAAADSPDVHMIGDFFSTGYFLGGGFSGIDGFATVPSAGGDRRFKATDNLSPLPQDRVFFNFHHFHNAAYDIDGDNIDVDRYTLGLERTYLDETISFEVRMPFTSALDATQDVSAVDTLGTEIGNLALTVKAFLWEWRSLKFAAGLATVLPTADDGSVQGDGIYTEMRNEAVHLQPYLGVHCSRPGRRLFSTTYIGVDDDINGNEIRTDQTGNGPGIISLGEIEDPTLLYCDAQVGYWFYRDYGHVGYLNGIAPVIEIHYSQILETPESIDGFYENPFDKASLLNLTMGLVFDFRRDHQVAIYAAAPLKQPEAIFNGIVVTPVFDAEVGAQWVYKY